MPNTSPEDRMADLEARSEAASFITDEMCDAALKELGQPEGVYVSRTWIRPGIAAALAVAPASEHVLRMQDLADTLTSYLESGSEMSHEWATAMEELIALVNAPRDAHE